MPELAEVEYYRKQWDSGLGSKIVEVSFHAGKRVFRGTDMRAMQKLKGATLVRSEARGKQMAFQFSKGLWLALHLGMTGKLRIEPAGFSPGKHDHLVLFQAKRALVFSDPRLFGRIHFFEGKGEPPWWSSIAPSLTSTAFTEKVLHAALLRHRRLPIKGTLLLQKHFPGVGNWMADEILWRSKIDPRRPSGSLTSPETKILWKSIRFVCREAMRHVGSDFSDPPPDWFFHERWGRKGQCPRDGSALAHATVGGRTTAWCSKCQH
jgi:formamidopyrimidine-DNA glycosylase